MVDLGVEYLKAQTFEEMADYLEIVAQAIDSQIQYLAKQKYHSEILLATKAYKNTRKLQSLYNCIAMNTKMCIKDIEGERDVRQTGR